MVELLESHSTDLTLKTLERRFLMSLKYHREPSFMKLSIYSFNFFCISKLEVDTIKIFQTFNVKFLNYLQLQPNLF